MIDILLDWLFPPRCLLCGESVPAGQALCGECRKDLPERPWERRLPLLEGAELLVVAPFLYEGGCRESLHRLKFKGKKGLARPFGQMMAETARALGPFDGVVWAPMTERGRQERGYDQSELLARAAAKRLKLPCLPLLRKTKDTLTQHELPKNQRRENVRGAYQAGPEAIGKSLLLVDDIVTTGSTLRECALALYRAGAAKVTGLCAANVADDL